MYIFTLIDRVFAELFGTNFNPVFFFLNIKVGLMFFVIYTLEMLVGAL